VRSYLGGGEVKAWGAPLSPDHRARSLPMDPWSPGCPCRSGALPRCLQSSAISRWCRHPPPGSPSRSRRSARLIRGTLRLPPAPVRGSLLASTPIPFRSPFPASRGGPVLNGRPLVGLLRPGLLLGPSVALGLLGLGSRCIATSQHQAYCGHQDEEKARHRIPSVRVATGGGHVRHGTMSRSRA
jgi:hypothetical protein